MMNFVSKVTVPRNASRTGVIQANVTVFTHQSSLIQSKLIAFRSKFIAFQSKLIAFRSKFIAFQSKTTDINSDSPPVKLASSGGLTILRRKAIVPSIKHQIIIFNRKSIIVQSKIII